MSQTTQAPAGGEPSDPPTNEVSVSEAAKTQCFSDDQKLGQALWPEPWASQATVQADYIGRVARLSLGGVEPTQHQRQIIDAIDHLLAHVRESSARRSWWQRPLDRWRGTSLERAHSNLHAAKVLLVDLLPEHEVDYLVPSAVARVSDCLRRRDIRRSQIEALLPQPEAPGLGPVKVPLDEKRARLKCALEIGYDAVDQQHSRIRGFRNLIIVVSAVIAAFMAVLVGVVWRTPASMPLCFEPSITSAQLPAPAETTPSASALPTPAAPSTIPTPTPSPQQLAPSRRVCPSGQDPVTGLSKPRDPSSQDVAIVAGLGLLGGATAAAFTIRKVRGTSTPYDVPLALAILKVPVGALTAVVGILLLGGGFVPGLSELDSQRQILAYALVFGYAQQLATRFIDNQAQNILGGVHSKDSKSKQTRRDPPQALGPPQVPPAPLKQASNVEPASSTGVGDDHNGPA